MVSPDPVVDETGADQVAPKSESFIVKVWAEDAATWRGHVTHVISGRRRYVQYLDDIPTFIAPYLTALGVTVQKRRPLRHWLTVRTIRRLSRRRS